MDEIWVRTVETALDGQTNVDLVRTLTLDSMVKCVHGRLPPPSIFDKFKNLQHLSMANIGVSSLENFPRLRNLQKLILSDNRITGGLEFLVEAGLESLRDLDLSNNRISDIDDLRPLALLRLVSLDLYECPVTRVKDYRSRVFGLIGSLKYLDKMDAKENERLESDEEDEEEDDDEEEEEDDPESGEVDGDDHQSRMNNWERAGSEGVVDVDEDEESDANEKETEAFRGDEGVCSGSNAHHHSNGFRVEDVDGEEDEDEGDEEVDLVEDVDEDVVEVHEVNDSDDGEDGVEDDEDDEDDEDEDEEEVDNDERDSEEPESTGRLQSMEGEIDGHEQGEDDADEDDDGETGEEEQPVDEEEQAVEEDGDFEDEEKADDEEDEYGSEYLVQPVGRVQAGPEGSDVGEGEDHEIEEVVEYEDDEDGEVQELLQPSSSHKRKRDNEEDEEEDNDEDM